MQATSSGSAPSHASRARDLVDFPPTELSDEEAAFKREVGDYLDRRLAPGSYRPSLGIAAHPDPAFSLDLGRQGLIGMSLPREYGGAGRSAVDRLIVTEELLARGAPVGHHWIADRQSGPSILANGTDAQRQEFLPGIAAGELSFAIGMSEPDSGSDLASLRTRAVRQGDDWMVNGTKVWTTGAATATHILATLRTGPEKWTGLTQFIIDRHAPGITVRPIEFIDGSWDFCEVVFEDVRVPDTCRLGEEGKGWAQNTGELALERGGVDRWMSLMPVLQTWVPRAARDAETRGHVARLSAMCWALRGMSLSIARQVDQGHTPVVEAALVKEMATRFEQDCVGLVAADFTSPPRPDSDDEYEALVAQALLISPSWTIRGGTNEILRGIIAKEMRR
ncbi:Acyl-CoA dehydrogenase fadE12 [Actinomadura madurae]|nr:acyl-CoA dehydrogenase family protein [Actinomadura madurae]SPT51272.1 Acyl-CoA dehydrogenase fadE12 [Actinomadura madurae]